MAQRSSSRKPRSSGASRRGGAKRGSVPGWVWLVTGLLVGLFAAFLIFLGRVDSSSPPQEGEKEKRSKESVAQKEAPRSRPPQESSAAAVSSGRSPATGEKATAPSNKEKVANATVKPATTTKKGEEPKEKSAVNYDFYKILPQYEVVVPEEDPRKPTTTVTSPGTYYLQVGAFRQMQEADSRKAALAMLGIVSSIQTVTIDAGNTWHRVRIGPVKDMRQLDRTKRQLQENSISFVTLKEKS